MSTSLVYAQAGGSDFMIQLLPILLMFVIFYFLLLRPQQQRVKQHRDMVANIRRGDIVVTGGGIIGKVTRVKEGDVEIEVDTEKREIAVPADLQAALDANPDAKKFFESLSYSNKRRHVEPIEAAKAPETRQRRIEKSIQLFSEGKV